MNVDFGRIGIEGTYSRGILENRFDQIMKLIPKLNVILKLAKLFFLYNFKVLKMEHLKI